MEHTLVSDERYEGIGYLKIEPTEPFENGSLIKILQLKVERCR
jgi:hypothetical protein